ncbi:hypothetical protein V6N11_048069 [Hibiscus sabdariffa]|uniref:Uncharacterized protein n=1 Tax=Hibiscus sabdariffa TaxID=183260 RepID=A0ABR1ZVS0_9ROSI
MTLVDSASSSDDEVSDSKHQPWTSPLPPPLFSPNAQVPVLSLTNQQPENFEMPSVLLISPTVSHASGNDHASVVVAVVAEKSTFLIPRASLMQELVPCSLSSRRKILHVISGPIRNGSGSYPSSCHSVGCVMQLLRIPASSKNVPRNQVNSSFAERENDYGKDAFFSLNELTPLACNHLQLYPYHLPACQLATFLFLSSVLIDYITNFKGTVKKARAKGVKGERRVIEHFNKVASVSEAKWVGGDGQDPTNNNGTYIG